MQNAAELYDEMHVVGHRFEMRSDFDYQLNDQFVWSGLTLRVMSKGPDDGHVVPNWPWRFMYGFEVIATEEAPGLLRGKL